jgi:hypothetical protein
LSLSDITISCLSGDTPLVSQHARHPYCPLKAPPVISKMNPMTTIGVRSSHTSYNWLYVQLHAAQPMVPIVQHSCVCCYNILLEFYTVCLPNRTHFYNQQVYITCSRSELPRMMNLEQLLPSNDVLSSNLRPKCDLLAQYFVQYTSSLRAHQLVFTCALLDH